MKKQKIAYTLIFIIIFSTSSLSFAQKYDVKWDSSDFNMTQCTTSADAGYIPAQLNLGRWYYYTLHLYEKAIDYWTRAADKGNATAQELLGECYFNGNGVDQDYKKAFDYYLKAANVGIINAQERVGHCYCNGCGVLQDYKQAIKWYTKAAAQGNAEAQYALGDCYFYGTGTEEDYNQAVKWYTKAATQGNPEYQYALGVLYYYGDEIDQDLGKAVEWLSKSAEQGNTSAQEMLDKLVISKVSSLKWELDDEKTGVVILGCAYIKDKGSVVKIVIPDTIEGKPVVGLKNEAFSLYTALSSVSLPNTITTLGERAFYGCKSLKTIKLPSSLATIGQNAFTGCSNMATDCQTEIKKYSYSGKF